MQQKPPIFAMSFFEFILHVCRGRKAQQSFGNSLVAFVAVADNAKDHESFINALRAVPAKYSSLTSGGLNSSYYFVLYNNTMSVSVMYTDRIDMHQTTLNSCQYIVCSDKSKTSLTLKFPNSRCIVYDDTYE